MMHACNSSNHLVATMPGGGGGTIAGGTVPRLMVLTLMLVLPESATSRVAPPSLSMRPLGKSNQASSSLPPSLPRVLKVPVEQRVMCRWCVIVAWVGQTIRCCLKLLLVALHATHAAQHFVLQPCACNIFASMRHWQSIIDLSLVVIALRSSFHSCTAVCRIAHLQTC